MCDICVMNRVKERMLSRRDFFKGTAAMAVGAAAVGGATATPRRWPMAHGGVVDMTHTLRRGASRPSSATPGFAYEKVFDFADNGFNLFNLTINEHTGTHIDAPLHFSADGTSRWTRSRWAISWRRFVSSRHRGPRGGGRRRAGDAR
jgi:hypothetical protein